MLDESSTMVLSAGVCRQGEMRLCVVGAVGTIDAVVVQVRGRVCVRVSLRTRAAVSVRSGGGGMLKSRHV